MEVTASIHLVGEKRIRELNKKYRKQNKVTDVLSFPLCEIREIRDKRDKEIGDVFLCVPRIKKQAKEYGVCLEEEFCRMLTHGVLHLLGFDHKNKKEAKKMFDLQEQIVKKL
ncbi:MAG: rRNA maturation RNase YbeY [Patescibacteria group bacterium]